MNTNKKNPLLMYLEDNHHFNSIKSLIPHLLSMPDNNATKNAISSSIYCLNEELTK